MLRRLWLLTALVWLPFFLILIFASQGDTSFLHIASHVLQLPLLAWAAWLVWDLRSALGSRTQRVLARLLVVTVPVAFVGNALELLTAVDRLAQDGWVNRDTADIWVEGPHVMIANATVPAMMLSMLGVVALVLAFAVQGRRRLELVD